MRNRNGGRFLDNDYDNSGNLRRRTLVIRGTDVTTFTYDVDGMPRHVRRGNRSERDFYDHNHRWFLAVDGGGSWRWRERDIGIRRNGSVAYVLEGGFASGRDLLVGQNPVKAAPGPKCRGAPFAWANAMPG